MNWLYEGTSVVYFFLSVAAMSAGRLDAATVFILMAIWSQLRKDEAT